MISSSLKHCEKQLQLGLLCTVSWDYRHCTWIKKEPGWNTLLTFKMSNGNGAHEDPCQKIYLLFPNISLPLTSLPVNCKHSPFQAPSLPNDQVRRSESRSWLINLMCCFLTPHFPWPVKCKLQFDLSCTVAMRLSALYIYKKRRTLVTSLQLNETYFRYFKISVLIKKCKPNWSTSKTIGIARSQMTHAIGFMVISEICNDIGTR